MALRGVTSAGGGGKDDADGMPQRFVELSAKAETLAKEHAELLDAWKSYAKVATEYMKAADGIQTTMESFVKKNKVLKLEMDVFFTMQKETQKRQRTLIEKNTPPFVANLESMQRLALSKLGTLRESAKKALGERNALHAKVLTAQVNAKKGDAAAQTKLTTALHNWKQAGTTYDLLEQDYENAVDDFENDKTYTLMTLLCSNMSATVDLYRTGADMTAPHAEYLSGLTATVKARSDQNMERKMAREREVVRLRTLNAHDAGIMDSKAFDKQSQKFVTPPDIQRLTGEGLVLKVDKVVCMSSIGNSYVPGILFVTTFRLVFRPYDSVEEGTALAAGAAAAAAAAESKDAKSVKALYPAALGLVSYGVRDLTVPLSAISHLSNVGGDRGLMSVAGKDLRSLIISFRHSPIDVSRVYDAVSQFVWSADNVFAYFHKIAPAPAVVANIPTGAGTTVLASAGGAAAAAPTAGAGAGALVPAGSAAGKSWDLFDPRTEWTRIGVLPEKEWRVSKMNDEYRCSPSYPSLLVVPVSITDEQLKKCFEFRTKKRVPALAWKLPHGSVGIFRSSQPKTSVGRSSSHDLNLLKHIGLSSAYAPPPPTPPPLSAATIAAAEALQAAADGKTTPPSSNTPTATTPDAKPDAKAADAKASDSKAPKANNSPQLRAALPTVSEMPATALPAAAAAAGTMAPAAGSAAVAGGVTISATPAKLAPNWTEHLSPDGVNKYWYNHVTQASSWFFPADNAATPMVVEIADADETDPDWQPPPPPVAGGSGTAGSGTAPPLVTRSSSTSSSTGSGAPDSPRISARLLPPPPAPPACGAAPPAVSIVVDAPAGTAGVSPAVPPAATPTAAASAAAVYSSSPMAPKPFQPQLAPPRRSAADVHRLSAYGSSRDTNAASGATSPSARAESAAAGAGAGASQALVLHLSEDELKGKTLVVVDCRPKIAAVGNMAKGGGWEGDSYINCALQFLGIDNIHAVREALRGLFALFETLPHAPPNSNAFPPLPVPLHIPTAAIPLPHPQPTLDFLGGLQKTHSARYAPVVKELKSATANVKWWKYVQTILAGAAFVVDMLTTKNRSVLVHCSDGWDRTSQISSLAQLLIDPYFRTLEGFCVLIEKEWCAFGHRFAQRYGHGTDHTRAKHNDTQRAPIFLQWVDCVYQIWSQYPNEFEFNVLFLAELVDYVHSCRFGTFLMNNEGERVREKLRSRTPSLWSFILHEKVKPYYVNSKYEPMIAYNRGTTKLYPAAPTPPGAKKQLTRAVYYTPLIAPTKLEQMRLFLPYYLRWDTSAPQIPSLAYTSAPK